MMMAPHLVKPYEFDARGERLSPSLMRAFWQSIRPASPFCDGVSINRWRVNVGHLTDWENNAMPVQTIERREIRGDAQSMGGTPITLDDSISSDLIELLRIDGAVDARIVNLGLPPELGGYTATA